MTTEIEGVDAEQAAQAYADGFDDDEQTTTPASSDDTEKVPAPEPVAKPEEPQAPKLAQITEQQFNDLMAKANQFDERGRQIDTLSGHLGGMKQVIEGLKTQRKQMTPGQLKRVAAEFPELAEALQEDLSELSGPSIDQEEVGKRLQSEIENRVSAKAVEFETKLLRFYHRDWEQVVSSDDFKGWMGTLSFAEQKQLNDSRDGEFIADKLTEFKAAKAARDKVAADAAAAAEKAAQAGRSSNTRQRRLEAAVPVRGTGGHSTSTQKDDFQAGWDSA